MVKAGENVDRTDLRLNFRVKHRLYDLDVLRARIEYAELPRRFEQTAKVLSSVGNKLLGIIPDCVAKYLQSFPH
jgi:hypothetical protein